MEDSFQSEALSDGEEHHSLDSDEAYDREQLEIALYSQIHFEENTETLLDDLECNIDRAFTIDIRGSGRTGYVAPDTTSDFILNRAIGEKYGDLPHKEDDVYKLKLKAKRNKDVISEIKRVTPQKPRSQGKILLSKGDKVISGKVDHKGDRKSKNGIAEQLILGLSSDNDLQEWPILDSDSESMFDSEDGQLYGMLGKQEKSDLDLRINVESSFLEEEFDSDYGE